MQAGLHLWNYTTPGGPSAIATVVADTAQAAEEGGFRQFTVMDHWFQMEAAVDVTEPMLEAYTTLGFIAAHTSRMRIGPLVTGVTYRHPGLLAKIVTTLDVLSGGRSVLGIGAAWYEREHLGLGVPYPAISERFERLEEAIQVVQQMWGETSDTFEGAYYRLAETLNSPRAVAAPHPPIMIGGRGERKTLRLAAQYAQIVNLSSGDPDEITHLLGVLRAHCDRLGTDYDAIEKQAMFSRVDPFSPDFVPLLERVSRAGIDLAVLSVRPNDQVGTARRLADEVLPKLAEV